MVKVCIAILSFENKVLICYENRTGFKNQWEFPGGKIETDETIDQALVREINEELGIKLDSFYSLGHYFTDSIRFKKIQIFVFYRDLNQNQFHSIKPKINQQIKLIDKNQMLQYQFLNGTYGAIYRYLLPDLYMITDEPDDDLANLINNWEENIEKGIRLIQLRAKKISQKARFELAKKLKQKMDIYGGFILVNSDIEVANQLNIGVHLPSKDLLKMTQRIIDKQRLISASCHSQSEIELAQKFADIALISPVNQNHYANHKDKKLISHKQIKEFAKGDLVVYALSAMKKEDVSWIQSLGAQGIAGISAFKG